MAPSPIRQLLVWSLPSVAVLLSYLWYKKRRIGARSDTGGSKPIEEGSIKNETLQKTEAVNIVSNQLNSEKTRAQSIPDTTPTKTFNRSLSGVESAPIDIVYPKDLKLSKSSPVIIKDEDLDFEIEKIKSMRNQYNSPSTIAANLSKTLSPQRAEHEESPENQQKQFSPDNKENTTKPPTLTSPKKESFEHISVSVSNSSNTVVQQGSTTPPPKVTPKKNKGKNNKDKKQEKSASKKMAQKDVAEVEEKMTTLKVSNNKESPKKETTTKTEKQNNAKNEEQNNRREVRRKNSGRDSANHSPSDAMMNSPSLSSMSDNHSEGSSDSGKGGSDVATPPSRTRTPQMNIINPNMPTTYEFVIPIGLVGKLIGRQGCFVQSIKDKCNAHVYVRRHPSNNRLKLCSVEGTQAEIDKALKMIRDKFPPKKYAEVTLEQVQLTPLIPTVPLIPDYLYLKLIEGINNDTILSCMVAPDHLFMQQPTHPSFPSLNMLCNCMNSCYNSADSPLLPSPIPENTVCAAFSIDSWYRAIVLSTDEETETSYVRFLDYGGYAYVENDKLRQIRQDFMLLPFQAAECFLSNVKSKNEDGTWPEVAYNLVADITKGSIIYTQVADYTPEGIPIVLCYVVTGPRDVVFLNQRLVDEGYADWVPFEEVPAMTTTAEPQQQPAEAVVA